MKNNLLASIMILFVLACGGEVEEKETKCDNSIEIVMLKEELRQCEIGSVDAHISKTNCKIEKRNQTMLTKVCLFAAMSCTDDQNTCLSQFEKCISEDDK